MAFTSVSMTSFDAKLKQWYIDKKRLYLMDGYKTKLLAAITKKTDAAGKGWNVAVGAASIVGGAGTYANSWANASAGQDKNFNGAYKQRFGHGFIDDMVIRASRNADGAIEPALENKLNQVRDQYFQGTEFQLFRSEFSSLGTVSSFTAGGTGGTITLSANTAKTATQRVRPDMILVMSGSAGSRTTTWKVDGITNSTIHVTPSAGSGSDLPTANDGFFIDGDGAAAGTAAGSGKALCGLGDWCPATEALAASTFKTVDRTLDTRALGGIRIDATGLRINEAFIQAGDEANRWGANSSIIFCHPSIYSGLKQELHSQVEYQIVPGKAMVGGMAKFGFKAMVLDGSEGQILVAPSWACPIATSYAVELESVWLETMGPWPSLKDLDGGPKMLRLTDGSNNSYVHELVGYGEFLCSAPGHQVAINHSTAA